MGDAESDGGEIDGDQLFAELRKHMVEAGVEIKGTEVSNSEHNIEKGAVSEELDLEEGEVENEIDTGDLLVELARRAAEAEADIAEDSNLEGLSINDAEATAQFEEEMMFEQVSSKEDEVEAEMKEQEMMLEDEARREAEAEAEILAEARRKADAEALAEARQAEAEALAEDRARRLADPSLALPVPSRPDWNADMEMLRAFVDDPNVSDEEKVRTLHEALVQRIDDEGKADEVKNRLPAAAMTL